MAYEFKTLGSVEALTEIPENANALVEVDGAIKRVPGGALGGSGGGEIFIIRNVGGAPCFDDGASLKIIDIITQGGFPQIALWAVEEGQYTLKHAIDIDFYNGSAVGGSGDFLTVYSSVGPLNFRLENNNFVFNPS